MSSYCWSWTSRGLSLSCCCLWASMGCHCSSMSWNGVAPGVQAVGGGCCAATGAQAVGGGVGRGGGPGQGGVLGHLLLALLVMVLDEVEVSYPGMSYLWRNYLRRSCLRLGWLIIIFLAVSRVSRGRSSYCWPWTSRGFSLSCCYLWASMGCHYSSTSWNGVAPGAQAVSGGCWATFSLSFLSWCWTRWG